MSSRSHLKDHGYDQEEMYFHKKDQELIQELKQKGNPLKGKAPPANQQESAKIIPLLPAQNHKKAA